MNSADWSLDPDVAYLNHGAFGALPRAVADAVAELRAELEANPNNLIVRRLPGLIDAAREQVAALLHADPAGSVWVQNATTGTATVLASLLAAARLGAGDEIVTTDHCYGAIARQLDRVAASGIGIRVAEVPLTVSSAADIVTAVASSYTPSTRLLVVDHVASPTGLVFPLAELVADAHERGIAVLVDAAHAPVMLDVDLAAIGADFWVGNLHKWGGSPRAAATLVVAPGWRDVVRPLVASHDFLGGFHQSFDWTGTTELMPVLAVPAALAWWSSYGLDRMRAEQHALATAGAGKVAAALGTSVLLPDGLTAAMRIVELPAPLTGPQARAIETALSQEHRIEVPLMGLAPPLAAGHGDASVRWVRVCGQVYNTADDYERLAAALPSVLAQPAP